jgi:hypothetical protein
VVALAARRLVSDLQILHARDRSPQRDDGCRP